ncbi:MAG: hypothetical protein ABII25_03090 [bacterium]
MTQQVFAQELISDLLSLSEDKLDEVKDFVEFLKSRSKKLSIKDVGMTKEEAGDLRSRLTTFEDDWNASGMEAYDKL